MRNAVFLPGLVFSFPCSSCLDSAFSVASAKDISDDLQARVNSLYARNDSNYSIRKDGRFR